MGKKEKEPRPYRGVIDEIREQQHKTKDMSLKGKWQYFWDYYKVHTITAVVVILLGGTLIHDILSAKDYAFYGIMLNSIGLSAESMETAFSEYAGIDLETYDCFIDTSSTLSYSTPSEYDMATMQKMVAQVQGHDLDAVVFDSQVFNNYANTEMFADLSEVLPPEEFQKHKDRFYYIDYAPIAKANEDSDYENEAMISSDEGAAASLVSETSGSSIKAFSSSYCFCDWESSWESVVFSWTSRLYCSFKDSSSSSVSGALLAQ